MVAEERDSFILRLYPAIFQILRYPSPTFLLNKYYFEPRGRDDKNVVEVYVLFNTYLSFLLVFAWSLISEPILKCGFVFWGGFRLFEILVVQVNALLFDYYRTTKQRLHPPNVENHSSEKKKLVKPYAIQGYTRITILLLHNFVEILFWFTVFYLQFPQIFAQATPLSNPLDALAFSFFTMTTFGHPPQMKFDNYFGYGLTLVQAIIGLFIALLILARFIALLPVAPSSDKVEQKMEEEDCKRKSSFSE
jgi:hypothetical protein